MHKIKPGQLTSGKIKHNYKGRIDRFVGSDNTFSFISSVKGAPPYWKQFFHDNFYMIIKLGTPTYVFTISCADLR